MRWRVWLHRWGWNCCAHEQQSWTEQPGVKVRLGANMGFEIVWKMDKYDEIIGNAERRQLRPSIQIDVLSSGNSPDILALRTQNSAPRTAFLCNWPFEEILIYLLIYQFTPFLIYYFFVFVCLSVSGSGTEKWNLEATFFYSLLESFRYLFMFLICLFISAFICYSFIHIVSYSCVFLTKDCALCPKFDMKYHVIHYD